jgi:hypothetical protein
MPGFEGERWGPAGQAFLFGCAVIGRTADWRTDREVIFYPDDLPESALVALRDYVQEKTWSRGARPRNAGDPEPDLIWRDEARLGTPVNGRSIKVQLLPQSEFLKLFYGIAYKDRGLFIGFDLAFHLSRLAADWHAVKKGANVGAWHLDLWTYCDAKTGKRRTYAGWRPSIIVNHKTPDVDFIAFTGCRGDGGGKKGSRYRGEFLDPANLARGLTGRHWTLPEALCAFTGEVIGNAATHSGRITSDTIDHCRMTLRATLSLTETLLDTFDRLHPVSRRRGGRLSETRLYSPGGLARAYLTAAGFTPPSLPENRLGPCVAASFGGWAEVQVRGRLPLVHVDFRREYQTVFLLQRLQDLLAAERLEFIDDTGVVRSLVEKLTIDDLLDPAIYPQLNVLCWIRPAGETMVGRWAFKEGNGETGPGQFSLAMAPRYSDDVVVAYLGDVLAAKILCKRACEIVRAERIVPVGRSPLRKTRLFGGIRFDPRKDQLFQLLVEEGERFSRGEGHYAKFPAPLRAAVLPGVKGIGNIGCFGSLIETREVDLLPDRREEVTLLSDGDPLRCAVAHPEDPGPFACPPIAGLVTAGGRLLLAMLHRLVADRGGVIAACDTDGAHIVATEKGGPVHIETRGADFYNGGLAEAVHALSWAEVDEICGRFEALNPFDRSLLSGSPLLVHRNNLDPAAVQIQLTGLFISPKRYSITRPDGTFADFKESILGMYLPPADDWIEQAWRTIGEIWDGRRLIPKPWFALPAVRTLTASSPAYAREVSGLPELRPWDRFLAASVIGRKPDEGDSRSEVVVAPFEPDPQRWATLSWRFVGSGEPVPLNHTDDDGVVWKLRTFRELLKGYAGHAIPEMLAPDGSPCKAYTRGVLRRRPVRDGERWVTLKEAAVYGDNPRHAFSVAPTEAVHRPSPAKQINHMEAWDRVIRPALAIIGPTAVAQKMGLALRSARAWAAGARRPEKAREVARMIVIVAGEAGLLLPADELLRAEEICAELPGRVASMQLFVSTMVTQLAEHFGSHRAFARALAGEGSPDLEPAVRRWLALGQGAPRPVSEINRIIAILAKFSRSEIRKMRRRIRTERGPIGDRQAIIAYLSLIHGAGKPVVPGPEELLALSEPLALGSLLSGLAAGRVEDETPDPLIRNVAADHGSRTRTHRAGTPGPPRGVL